MCLKNDHVSRLAVSLAKTAIPQTRSAVKQGYIILEKCMGAVAPGPPDQGVPRLKKVTSHSLKVVFAAKVKIRLAKKN